ncbi:MAG: hypothetical protein IPO78_17340 [Saprospiraceae bacterium]|nr:hypothetical protein [Saprospiraceae bacterium]
MKLLLLILLFTFNIQAADTLYFAGKKWVGNDPVNSAIRNFYPVPEIKEPELYYYIAWYRVNSNMHATCECLTNISSIETVKEISDQNVKAWINESLKNKYNNIRFFNHGLYSINSFFDGIENFKIMSIKARVSLVLPLYVVNKYSEFYSDLDIIMLGKKGYQYTCFQVNKKNKS